jgi:metal-dependent amidase/aminoacylase/carboxypeptidase family protein
MPPTYNYDEQTEHCLKVLKNSIGEEYITNEFLPDSGSEDFAFYLE